MRQSVVVTIVMILMLCIHGRPTEALLIPTDDSGTQTRADQRTQDLETIRHVLEIKVLQQRLADLGFSSSEIAVKLGGLSDQQVHDLAQQIESVMVGGFHGADDLLHGGLLSILVIAAIVVLVLLLI